jgi:hypothetical protein
MANFDTLLSGLHDNAILKDEALNSDDGAKYITINSKRQFEVPVGYNTVIAYEGDVNSQIITFDCPA